MANAYLISADLLEALKEVIAASEQGSQNDPASNAELIMLNIANAAVRRASGA